jgi:hypothetical protein
MRTVALPFQIWKSVAGDIDLLSTPDHVFFDRPQFLEDLIAPLQRMRIAKTNVLQGLKSCNSQLILFTQDSFSRRLQVIQRASGPTWGICPRIGVWGYPLCQHKRHSYWVECSSADTCLIVVISPVCVDIGNSSRTWPNNSQQTYFHFWACAAKYFLGRTRAGTHVIVSVYCEKGRGDSR